MSKTIVRITILALALALLVSGCGQSTPKELTAAEVLSRVQENSETMKTFYGRLEMKSEIDSLSEAQDFEIWFNKDGRYRMAAEVPEVGEFITVYDGTTLWLYTEAEQSVLKMEMGLEELANENNLALDMLTFISDPEEYFTFEYQGVKEKDGRMSYVLKVGPKEEALDFTMTWWVDPNTWFPVSYQLESEGMTFVVDYSKLEVNPSLPADTFTFTPPAGVEIIDMGNFFGDYDLNLEDLELAPELEEQLQQ